MKSLMILLCAVLSVTHAWGQGTRVYDNSIRSVRTNLGGQWDAAPVLTLGGGNHIEISFDDMQHNFVRYNYTLSHYDSEWNHSDLLESEFAAGFHENQIHEYEQSVNTQMEYLHYTLRIPNEDIQPLISGNYKVTVYDDNEDDPLFETCFYIVEPKVGITMTVDGNTDIDTYAAHQQVSFTINHSSYYLQNPASDLKPVVYQNRRPDTRVSGLKPTYMRTNELIYSHNRRLIYPAGNEYRRFEILDPYVPTMHVERMQYHEPFYHAILFGDEPRENYIFDQDQDGRFIIRNDDNYENDYLSDYFFTHFTLFSAELSGGSYYVCGDLTNNQYTELNRMAYNLVDHCYEAVIPLKQGTYNYQYLFVPDDSPYGLTAEAEGDFHQTENEYTLFVYHRPFGCRYDKLVGYLTMMHNKKGH